MDNNMKLIGRLTEIREACSVAASLEDTNFNEIIEEIDRLAIICIANIKEEKVAH